MDLWVHDIFVNQLLLKNVDNVYYTRLKIRGLSQEMNCVYFKIFIIEGSIIFSS
jgi:hypothetical protein